MNGISVINCVVNGETVELPFIPGEMLSDLLRERLGLTGTKIGCNEAECGACTVLVDDEPVLSCTYPAARANGKRILTIEGLAPPGERGESLHPLQEAFVVHGAVQCGFCIPGQIMTAYALLRKQPDPRPQDVRSALKDTLCRCAGYPTIERAILAAAKAARTGQAVEAPEVPISTRAQRVVGQFQLRPEAVEKVTGRALYSDDLKFEGMLHGRAKRAEVPHAIVRSINTEKAKALPGVQAVLTAADIPNEHNHGLVYPDWPALVGVGERVRYVGDTVAIVAADTRDIASQALDLIEVTYEKLPVIGDPVQARRPETMALHESGNLLKHIKVRKGDVEQGFAQADHVFEHTFYTATTDHAFIEPECSIARLTPEGRMEIYVGSQIPYSDRNQVARVLGWPEERVTHHWHADRRWIWRKKRYIAGQIHAALLTNATGKPVKILYDRHESLLVHPKRHATQIRVKMGVNDDGSLVAVETELYGDTARMPPLGD